MMAFNPFPQIATSIKGDDGSSAEALRLLASSNFLTAGGPLQMPQMPVEAVRAMLPNGFPFPLVYPGLTQDFKPELFSAGGGPMPLFMGEAFGFHPYAGLDGARRKNATRETTAPLKEWLNSHRTNPYPTKPEKIYLAVMTKMTLTQVSTWFANARRRLKKENGGSVSIKRRDGEDDDDDMAELDRPSSSASNLSGGSNIKDEIDVDEKEQNENVKLEGSPLPRDDLTPKKKMLSIDDILGMKDNVKKGDDEASSSKKDSPSSSEEAGPVMMNPQLAAFQQMMAMYSRNPQILAAMSQQRGATGTPFFSPFNPQMMSMMMSAVPTTPTGVANGSFTSEATSASPSSSHSAAASKESSPQPKSD